MKLNIHLSLAIIFFGFSSLLHAEGAMIDQIPPSVTLTGDSGGRVSGGDWKSDEMRGKVHVLFYVDPDEKDTNQQAAEALKAENFPLDKYASVAIINMAATWAPNFAIESNLKKKQKEFPNAVYVKDFKKVLVEKWQIRDDSSDVMVFDPSGKLIFLKNGMLSDDEVKRLLDTVKAQVAALSKTSPSL